MHLYRVSLFTSSFLAFLFFFLVAIFASACATNDEAPAATCSNKADGTACNDGNACTQSDTCQAGVCTGANPVVCAAQDQCHLAGTCNSATGACSNPAKTDGTACNDGNACTQSDTCQAGVCTGANPVVCAAQDQCHLAGTCNSATGACSNPAKTDGTACNDGNACTQSDTCQAGVCRSASLVICSAPDQCHLAGTCNPATGICSYPAKTDGTACNDGNACTVLDMCSAGTCTGLDNCTNGGSLDTALWLATWPIGSSTSLFVGDFNGDGLGDVLRTERSAAAEIWVGLSTGTAFASRLWGSWPSLTPTVIDWDYLVGDFDGDGETDLVRAGHSGAFALRAPVTVARSTGSGFQFSDWLQWSVPASSSIVSGDFDGDGKTDLAAVVWDTGEVLVARSTGSSFDLRSWATLGPLAGPRVLIGDFDGDGRDDVVVADCSKILLPCDLIVALSTGTGFAPATWGQSQFFDAIVVGDFDGDGKSDLAMIDRITKIPGDITVARSTGSGFAPQLWERWWAPEAPVVGDFNGDHRSDLLKIDRGSPGGVFVGLSLGTILNSQLWADWWTDASWTMRVADFDGDGRDDLVGFRPGAPGAIWVGLSRVRPQPFNGIEPVTISQSLTRYVRKKASGAFDLFLTSSFGTPWHETYTQANEPDANYCGPTAGMNLLYWYGNGSISYAQLASAMKTNAWDRGALILLCGPACLFEPTCVAACTLGTQAVDVAGTLPADMESTLAQYAPAGYHLVARRNNSGALSELLAQVSEGNPVLFLESEGTRNLHWAVVTGSYAQSGQLYLRIANATEPSVPAFLSNWSLEQVGDSILQGVLSQVGIEPYIMFYYDQ